MRASAALARTGSAVLELLLLPPLLSTSPDVRCASFALLRRRSASPVLPKSNDASLHCPTLGWGKGGGGGVRKAPRAPRVGGGRGPDPPVPKKVLVLRPPPPFPLPLS